MPGIAWLRVAWPNLQASFGPRLYTAIHMARNNLEKVSGFRMRHGIGVIVGVPPIFLSNFTVSVFERSRLQSTTGSGLLDSASLPTMQHACDSTWLVGLKHFRA